MYGNIAEGGGRGTVHGLCLEGRVRSMLTVMLGGDFHVATLGPRHLGSGLGLGLGDPYRAPKVRKRKDS